MKRKKLVTLFVAAAIASSALGSSVSAGTLSAAEEYANNCGAVPPEEVTPDDSRKSTANSDEKLDTLNLSLFISATDLSPYYGGDPSFQPMSVYETLLWQTGANEYVGYLAKDFYEEDDTHFIVELYDYITDSEGNNITASDVVFSYNLFIESGEAQGFDDFESVEAVDDYTVRFTWKEPLTSLSYKSSMLANCYIVSEKAYNEHDMVTDPVGTGSYIITDFVTDSYVDLKAREDYWQTDELRLERSKANVENIHVDFITDSAQRLIALENGSVTCDTSILSTDVTDLLEGEFAGQFTMTVDYSTDIYGILPNMSEGKITADENFRLALWYALDSEAICAGLGENMYIPCTTIATRAAADYQSKWDDLENYLTEYDIEKAKEYLAASGYNGETLTILVEQFPAEKMSIAQIMQNFLQMIGVNVEIKQEEHAICMEDAQNPDNWDFWICSSTYNDYISRKLESWFDTSRGFAAGCNQAFLVDSELDEMLETAGSVDGYSDEANDALLTYVLEKAYVYPVCFSMSYSAWSPVYASVYSDPYDGTFDAYGACDFYLD